MIDVDCEVHRAKISEYVERYVEMAETMKAIVETGKDLTVEERNLLSVAYKNKIGSKRSSWRVCNAIEQNERTNGDPTKANLALQYRELLEKELTEIVDEILTLIDKYLIKDNASPDSKVFYLKMKGDYYRYKAEFLSDSEREEASAKSNDSYKEATNIANIELQPTHPIRLGLALNYSVYFYEIGGNPTAACTLAKTAFDEAIVKLDQLSEDSYKDSTLIMQLLRDNLTLWNSHSDGEEDGKKEEEKP